jgi:hypothetical protein
MTYPSLLKVTAAETNVITETQTPPIFDENGASQAGITLAWPTLHTPKLQGNLKILRNS